MSHGLSKILRLLILTMPVLLFRCSESNFKGADKKSAAQKKADVNKVDTDVPVPAQPTADPLVFGDGTTTAEILNACASKTKIKKKIHIDFAEDNTVCQWGQNGNLPRIGGTITAAEVQYQGFNVDEAAAICGMTIYSNTPAFRIDDEAVFTISNGEKANDYVMYSDWFSMNVFSKTRGMETLNNVVIFDRLKLIGTYFGGIPRTPESAPGIENTTQERKQTGSGVVGPFNFKMTSDFLKNLPTDFLLSKQYKVGLWVDGDDNSSDCTYSAIGFDVEVEYLAK